MGSIVVSIQQRIARMTAIIKKNATETDAQMAKTDYIAMMADVDLSAIEDGETEGMSDAQQEV